MGTNTYRPDTAGVFMPLVCAMLPAQHQYKGMLVLGHGAWAQIRVGCPMFSPNQQVGNSKCGQAQTRTQVLMRPALPSVGSLSLAWVA